VIRKIDEAVPSIVDEPLRAFLRVMAKGHEVNISDLDDKLKEGIV
jgi:hypothetical protein